MAGPLIVGAEGVVLVPDKDSYSASRPIDGGMELLLQLRNFPTSTVHLVVGQVDTTAAKNWCMVQGLKGVNVVPIAPEDEFEEPWLAQWYAIERLRAAGSINLVITAYTEVFERCLASYLACSLYGRLGLVRVVDAVPSWDDLHGRTVRDRVARAEQDAT